MGIYINGNIKMPKNCYNCWFGHECPKYEALLWNEISKERKVDCPLSYVSPHGRLGDLDALCKTLRSLAENEYTPEVFANWIENHIDTIIQASEEHTMEEFMYGQEGNPNDGSM